MFERIVRAHQGALRSFLFRLCRNRATADDLAQETFIRAYDRIGTLKTPDAVKGWLFKIAYHCWADRARKHARRRELAEENISPPEESLAAPTGLRLDISEAMDSLAADCRAVMILSLVHGMSHGEISDVTGMPLGTVKSHLARGKAKLRELLKAYA